ncbi:MAG: LytR C-terminal domain-containing protein [Gemmatimonadales bacterium]|nr:LytR C-terminal domain-containing protein [Gemmatimonadales bacterium]
MGTLEQPGRGRLVVGAIVALGLIGGTAAALFRTSRFGPVVERARAIPRYGSDRIVVEVINATPSVGLARAATRRLRDAGLDVVYFGSDTGAAIDSTLVLVRRGPVSAAEQAVEALGAGAVRAAPDPGRLVDITVRLGRDFAGLVSAARDP